MVNIRFFGILRLNIKKSSMMIESSRIDELLKKIAEQIKEVDYKQLSNSIIFVNGIDICELKGLKTLLHDGDEVQFFSPVSGG